MAAGVGAVVAGRYRLLGLIGSGGMGSVWRAHDQILDREVAAKQLLEQPGLTAAEQDLRRRRVSREARASARLSHHGVATVFDVVEDAGLPWIIMELVEARSLQEIVDAEGPIPAVRLAALGRQVLEALAHAHGKGILHRDVKPSNVLVTPDGRAVLTDFGIAQLEGDARLTQTGAAIGSPAYMAPEQIQGEPVTAAADLWSLGVTLYTAAEGRSPFQRTDAMATLAAVLTAPLPDPRRAGALSPVLAGLLQRDPARRMSAPAAIAALSAVIAGQPAQTVQLSPPTDPLALPYGTLSPPAGRSMRSRTVGILGGLAVAVAAAAVVIVVLSSRTSSQGGGAPRTSGAPSEGSPSQPSPSATSAQSTPARTASAPAGFHRYRDGTGFALPVPDGWRGPDHQSAGVFFHSPDGASLIQIDQTSSPGASALQDWRDQESSFSKNHPGYQRVRLAATGDAPPVPDATGDRSADWEYTYDARGGRRHVLDRGFVVNGRGYAILVSSPDNQWSAITAQLRPVYSGFVPATP